ncbi:hypothetical protein D3C81_2171630 [compost metagenome]
MTTVPQGIAILSGGSFGAEGSLVTTIIMVVGCIIGINLFQKSKSGSINLSR